MDEVIVNVEAEVNPTEDLEKVKSAVENIFGNMSFKILPARRGSLLIAETQGMDGLALLHDLFRKERIRDAARRVLRKGTSDKSVVFHLNKQVAFVGHISFSKAIGESPLGPIKVEIRCDNPQKLVEQLAPKTARSKRKKAARGRFA
ncbi:MAG: hypothetical protein KAJ19_25125 [Gammaproteobacteria bacterium]|nr:hypothetical protein [Gammaproteobacteria bacterium]